MRAWLPVGYKKISETIDDGVATENPKKKKFISRLVHEKEVIEDIDDVGTEITKSEEVTNKLKNKKTRLEAIV